MKMKMDEVDTKQQRQIDALIMTVGVIGMILTIWCATLTVTILEFSKK